MAEDAPEALKGHQVGYARVSMKDQSVQRQIDELIAYGVEKEDIFEDNASGKSMARPGWQALWRDVRAGDTVVVHSLDRLGRNVIQVLQTIDGLKQRGVGLVILTNRDLDTSTETGRLMVSILASLGEWERASIVKRTQHGIDRAKERGVKGGRKPKITQAMMAQVAKRTAKGETLKAIAESLKVHPNTLYKRMETYRRQQREKRNATEKENPDAE